MDFLFENKILWKRIGIIAGVYVSMKYLVPLVIPFLIAGLLVSWLWPFLTRLQKKIKIKPPVVLGILLTGFLFFLFLGIYWGGRQIGQWIWELCTGSAYQREWNEFLEDCCRTAGELLHMEADKIQVYVVEQANFFIEKIRTIVFPAAMGGSWQAVKGAAGWVTGFMIMIISTLLLAGDFEKLKEAGRKYPLYERGAGIMKRILSSVGGYLRAQCLIMGIIMVLCSLGVWISGSSLAPLAGIGIGFLDALPVFGTGTVFIPWALLRFLQGEYISALILTATYIVCMVTRELLEPKLIGGRLGILPVVILISIYAGVKLYGFGGIILGPLSVLFIQELWKETEV